MHTPWGAAQHRHVIAPGIVSVSTAGHGGIWLDACHQREVEKVFPDFTPFAGAPWYEEDQDWAIVALVFPEHFSDQDLRNAFVTAEYSAKPFDFGTQKKPAVQRYPKWERVVEWLSSPAAEPIRLRVTAFMEQTLDKWEHGSMSCPVPGYPPHSWSVSFKRARDGARKDVVLAGYPAQQFYTDAELESVTAQPLPVIPQEPYKPPRFREEECGGVYDGVGSVTSDADPGL